jgi:hypothetical protein
VALALEAEERFDQRGIGGERDQAARVARGVEKIRILRVRVIGLGQPTLHERRAGGEQDERRTDREREPPEQPERGTGLGRRPARWPGERKRDGRGDQQRHVNHGVPARAEPARPEVRVEVAREQRDLEEPNRRRPDRRASAENRQEPLDQERLEHEQQRRRQERRRGVEGDQHRALGPAAAHLVAAHPPITRSSFMVPRSA